jgi:hypothetical protein
MSSSIQSLVSPLRGSIRSVVSPTARAFAPQGSPGGQALPALAAGMPMQWISYSGIGVLGALGIAPSVVTALAPPARNFAAVAVAAAAAARAGSPGSGSAASGGASVASTPTGAAAADHSTAPSPRPLLSTPPPSQTVHPAPARPRRSATPAVIVRAVPQRSLRNSGLDESHGGMALALSGTG